MHIKAKVHTSALEYLLTNDCFHADALEFVENMLANLKSTLERKSGERAEQERRAEKEKKQKNLFLGYFKQTKFASGQGDTSSGSNGVSGQHACIDN